MAVITETARPVGRSAFDALDPPEAEKYRACVHCGLCLSTCPTHVVLGEEMDSPRGRIYLIRAADEGRIGITDTFVKHMNLCLLSASGAPLRLSKSEGGSQHSGTEVVAKARTPREAARRLGWNDDEITSSWIGQA